jgi:hypothetical protein
VAAWELKMSPAPLKACSGHFDAAVQDALLNDRERSRWQDHRCEGCGQMVSAQVVKGVWEPAPHWPSVNYSARKKRVPGRYSRLAEPTAARSSGLPSAPEGEAQPQR